MKKPLNGLMELWRLKSFRHSNKKLFLHPNQVTLRIKKKSIPNSNKVLDFFGIKIDFWATMERDCSYCRLVGEYFGNHMALQRLFFIKFLSGDFYISNPSWFFFVFVYCFFRIISALPFFFSSFKCIVGFEWVLNF
ncbi:hypothetical protein AMTRI_Chr13g124880 [Amborella trichopoda]